MNQAKARSSMRSAQKRVGLKCSPSTQPNVAMLARTPARTVSRMVGMSVPLG